MQQSPGFRDEIWPSLPVESWSDTFATLHMWTQIVGKIRLTPSPWVNHSWHTTLYVTSKGLTTSRFHIATGRFKSIWVWLLWNDGPGDGI